MHEQKNKTQMNLANEKKCFHYPDSQKLAALAFDRDKNWFYLANDESIDEVLDSDGYHVVHANRNLSSQEVNEREKVKSK